MAAQIASVFTTTKSSTYWRVSEGLGADHLHRGAVREQAHVVQLHAPAARTLRSMASESSVCTPMILISAQLLM